MWLEISIFGLVHGNMNTKNGVLLQSISYILQVAAL